MVAPFHCSLVPKVGLSERRPAGGNFIAWREAGAVPGTASPLREAQLPHADGMSQTLSLARGHKKHSHDATARFPIPDSVLLSAPL